MRLGARRTAGTRSGRSHTTTSLVFALLALLCLALLPGARAAAELRAGAARISITPDPQAMPYGLGGYVDAHRLGHKATGIHDTCYARALVLESGGAKCAIVSLDLCFMPASVKSSVLARIGSTGIPASSLFLSATHTHSAPDPLELHAENTGVSGDLPKYDPKLADWISGQIAQSIGEADARLRPARVGSGQMEQIGLNRNRRGEKITDDEMTALKVVDGEGNPIAAVFDYAAHPVYYGSSMLEVSGDWAGAFERQMEAVLAGAVVLFLNGAEGDASPAGADDGTSNERIETYSAKICRKANKLLDSIAATTDAPVRAWTRETELGSPKPHPLFLLAALRLHATRDQALALVERLMPTRCEVSFVRVGDALFIGVPGEPTAPIGLEIKAMARAKGVRHPAVVALTNGWLGYLVTADQYRAGKYEASMSFYGESSGSAIVAGVGAGLAR